MIRPIVFAAGLGKRMGAIKALIEIDEKPALAVVLNTIARANLQSPIVVLGRDARVIQQCVCLDDCQVVVNERPEQGLSGSMRLALAHLDETVSGILAFHVDMPYLSLSTVHALLQAIDQGATLAAPCHRSVRGFPVYFHRSFFEDLGRSLQGDSGGRRFLELHKEDLVRVPVDDPGCTFDLDSPSDLEAWKGERLCATKE